MIQLEIYKSIYYILWPPVTVSARARSVEISQYFSFSCWCCCCRRFFHSEFRNGWDEHEICKSETIKFYSFLSICCVSKFEKHRLYCSHSLDLENKSPAKNSFTRRSTLWLFSDKKSALCFVIQNVSKRESTWSCCFFYCSSASKSHFVVWPCVEIQFQDALAQKYHLLFTWDLNSTQ